MIKIVLGFQLMNLHITKSWFQKKIFLLKVI